jgi:hypothetical protein
MEGEGSVSAEERESRYADMMDRWGLHGFEPVMVPQHDLAEMMRRGVPDVEMTLDEWLVKGELHWVHADAEAYKTWLGLILSRMLMQEGKRVAWFDEELGHAVLVERLLALGADPDVVESHFAYWDFPNMQTSDRDIDAHKNTLAAIRPALVVYDTATDMLAAADIDENSGKDVTNWVKAFPEQARQLGITQLVLDHTGKDQSRGAVGSRAKRAKAKVQYFLKAEEKGDVATIGKVRVKLDKNTRGAKIPKERVFRIGGGSGETGGFVFEAAPDYTSKQKKTAALANIRSNIEQLLQEHGPLVQSQLTSMVPGGTSTIIAVAKEMAAEPLVSGVSSSPNGPRGAITYSWVGKQPLPR